MRIATNVMALGAWKNLVQTTSGLSKTLERLSSGQRINRAADDAAGLTISEMMRAQIRGLNQALRNAQDGISLVQTAEGALGQVHAILQRLRELAVQASTDTLTDTNREAIQKEVRQLTDQINQIANTTHFNTVKLLNGNLSGPPASAARIEGADVPGPVVISGAWTAGYAQGQAILDTGHTGSTPKAQPAYVTGSQDLRSASARDLTWGTTDLRIGVDGTEYVITLTPALYGTEGSLLAEINTRLAEAGAPVVASVSTDGFHRLVLTHFAPGSEHTVQVLGGGAYDRLIGTATPTAGADEGDVWIHAVTDGYTAGSQKITDPGLEANPVVIGAGSNTLQLRYSADGLTWNDVTVTLADAVYDGADGRMRNDLLADLQASLNAAVGGPGIIVADFEPDHTLRLTYVGGGARSRVEVTGGDQALGRLFGDPATHLRYVGEQANNVLTFSLNGQPQLVTLTSGHYDDADAVVAELNARFTASGIDATASHVAGAVRITSNTTGSGSSVTDVGGSAAAELNLANATEVRGTSGNRQLSLTVDGEAVTVTLPEGTYGDLNALAALLEDAINDATQTAADVTVTYDGRFVMTSGTTGESSRLAVNPLPEDDAASTLGLSGLSARGSEGKQVVVQIGANSGEATRFPIGDMRARALGLTTTDPSAEGYDGTNPLSNDGATEYALSLKTRRGAERALEVIDGAIRAVSSERANLGAVQNRFEHTIDNLMTTAQNLTAAESRIRDADMALEMMEFVRQQILLQSGTAMLAQANVVPQTVLQLLG